MKAKIKYVYDENYSVIKPADAFGGMSPNGDLTVNLNYDINEIPDIELYDIDKKSTIKKESKKMLFADPKITYDKKGLPNQIPIKRVVLGTLLIKPKNAMSIATWMLKTIITSKLIEVDEKKLISEISNYFSD